MRLRAFALSTFLLILASCAGPTPTPIPLAPSPSPTIVAHAPEIRFALVGQPTAVNVWSLFDESGASYANYAIHSDEYPRLYRLSIPEREFEPFTADGMPSAVTQEGDYLVAGAKLQPGLHWSDDSPLTAQDTAFTVNTALAFHLSLDWLSAYNPALLDRAEAVDDSTVKFYFKGPFNVGDWQYGALQGPIVSEAYWSPKIQDAIALLPSAELISSLEATQAEAAVLQGRVDADNAQLLTTLPNTTTYSELSARVVRNQNELNSVNSRLGEVQDEYDAGLNAARSALFALTDDGEPTFGPFLRAVKEGDRYTRDANPNYPFEQPNFDRAVYVIHLDQSSAISALNGGDVNAILDVQNFPQELYQREIEEAAALNRAGNPTSSVRFIALNPAKAFLAEPALRLVMLCAMARVPARIFTTWSFETYIPSGNDYWQSPTASDQCGPFGTQSSQVVDLLQSTGYTWQQEPDGTEPGQGLILPDGAPFPAVTVLAPSEEIEPTRAAVAQYIEEAARDLGIPFTVKFVSAEELRYAVYGSGEYDLAILGYRVGEYPGYLCDWFQTPSPFEYGSDRLGSACEAFDGTADLETARRASFEIQSILIEDLPFIPLYQVLRYEAYRGVAYPFENVLDGISGLYGAPALAIPAP